MPLWERKEGRKSIYIALFWPRWYTQSAQAWITQFYLQITLCLPFLREHSPDVTTTAAEAADIQLQLTTQMLGEDTVNVSVQVLSFVTSCNSSSSNRCSMEDSRHGNSLSSRLLISRLSRTVLLKLPPYIHTSSRLAVRASCLPNQTQLNDIQV